MSDSESLTPVPLSPAEGEEPVLLTEEQIQHVIPVVRIEL